MIWGYKSFSNLETLLVGMTPAASDTAFLNPPMCSVNMTASCARAQVQGHVQRAREKVQLVPNGIPKLSTIVQWFLKHKKELCASAREAVVQTITCENTLLGE